MKHSKLLKLKSTIRLQFPAKKPIEKSSFHYELIDALISANILIEKINNFIVSVLLKITLKKSYIHTHYRNVVLDKIFAYLMDAFKLKIKSSDGRYLIFDETTD